MVYVTLSPNSPLSPNMPFVDYMAVQVSPYGPCRQIVQKSSSIYPSRGIWLELNSIIFAY